MSEAPERIWVRKGEVVKGRKSAFDDEYTRADLHDDLVKAADELAEAVYRVTVKQWAAIATMEDCSFLDTALAAYKTAKEKLK